MSSQGDSVVQSLLANAGDKGLTPGSRRSPGEGNGNPLQCSCLENPMDRESWQAAVHGGTESWRQLRDWTWAWFCLYCLFKASFLISESLEFMMIIFSWQQRKILLKEAHVGEGMEWASNGGTFHWIWSLQKCLSRCGWHFCMSLSQRFCLCL